MAPNKQTSGFAKQIIVNYIVRDDRVEENIRLVQEVLRQLNEQQPEGVRYAAYKMGDNVFVHVALFRDEAADKAFTNLPAFQAFRRNMSDRLEEKPIVNEVVEIGRYTCKG